MNIKEMVNVAILYLTETPPNVGKAVEVLQSIQTWQNFKNLNPNPSTPCPTKHS